MQRDLAARLGVSQTPVRASLGRLEREGFVAVGLDRPRVREQADARGLRGDLRGAARARGPGGEARRDRARRGETARDGREDARAAASGRPRSRTSTRTSRSAGSSTARATARAVGGGSSARSSGLYRRSERYNRLVLSTPRRASASRSAATRRSRPRACEVNDGASAESAPSRSSLRWAVDTVAGGLPSESGVQLSSRRRRSSGSCIGRRRSVQGARVADGESELDLHAADISFHRPQRPDLVVYPSSTRGGRRRARAGDPRASSRRAVRGLHEPRGARDTRSGRRYQPRPDAHHSDRRRESSR